MVDLELLTIRDELIKKYGRKFKGVYRCEDGGIYAENREGKIKIIKPCSGSHKIDKKDIWNEET